jgi:hypothetical protein
MEEVEANAESDFPDPYRNEPAQERRVGALVERILTTPDCSEGLKWIVMKMPVEVSEQEIALFRAMYANNARPVQALNNRIILESE